MGVKGRIHSIESFGAVDGPGIRFVLFVQGCGLRCLYCHNPDTWAPSDGREIDSDEIISQIESYKDFIRSGGVTISGGEPLLQPDFTLDILRKCAEREIHTAIDTAGDVPLCVAKPMIDAADMLLLDIKSLDEDLCKKLTGKSNKNALAVLEYCNQTNKTIWIRHVLVPGYTLDKVLLTKMAEYLKPFTCIEKIELLPFHKMGEYKWELLKRAYSLADTKEPTAQEIAMAHEIFAQRGFDVL